MLPIIRLAQPNTPVVRQGYSPPGQWVMFRDTGELVQLNRFKMLVLSQRPIMVHFDLYQNHYITARHGELEQWQALVAAKLSGKNVSDGSETLVWLPHYRELAVVQLNARSGVRAFRDLVRAELYGVGSRSRTTNGRSFYVPSVERLNLPTLLDNELSSWCRSECHQKFQDGLAV